MPDNEPYDIANAGIEHADKVLRAAGTGLRQYTTQAKQAILAAMMDAVVEAYRAGADYAAREYEKRMKETQP